MVSPAPHARSGVASALVKLLPSNRRQAVNTPELRGFNSKTEAHLGSAAVIFPDEDDLAKLLLQSADVSHYDGLTNIDRSRQCDETAMGTEYKSVRGVRK
jgi:hypothetical protein